MPKKPYSHELNNVHDAMDCTSEELQGSMKYGIVITSEWNRAGGTTSRLVEAIENGLKQMNEDNVEIRIQAFVISSILRSAMQSAARRGMNGMNPMGLLMGMMGGRGPGMPEEGQGGNNEDSHTEH